MAMSKEKKRQVVEELTALLQESQGLILTDYRGLSVSDMTRLRRKLRDAGVVFRVVKNTLTKLALQEAGLQAPDNLLEGPTAVAFLGEDVSGPAKTLLDFARQSGILTIKGGLIGSIVMDAEAASALARLPGREVLLAQLVAAIQGPMVNLTGLLTAPMRDLVYVLQARAEGGAAAGQEPAAA